MATSLPKPDLEDETSNDWLLAALIRRQIGLFRFTAYESQRLVALLNRTEAALINEIREKLDERAGLQTVADFRRYERLTAALTAIRVAAWREIEAELTKTITDLAFEETKYINLATITAVPVILHSGDVTKLLTDAGETYIPPAPEVPDPGFVAPGLTGIVIETKIPNPELLKAIATRRPFQGRLLKDWAASMADEDMRRIKAQLQAGMVAGESADQIARRIVGTQALKGGDGVTEVTRRNMVSITQTAISHITHAARAEFYAENEELFELEQFVATLDSRTTLVCMGNDGKRFPIGKGPMPPLHIRCRSLRVPVINDGPLSNRPAKNITNEQVMREFAETNGIAPAKNRDALPRGFKTKYDEYSRKRIREMTGTVPGTTTYQEFLKKQSKEFQEDVLGKTKAKLFRDGNLSLDKFTNRNGDELTLSQLARTDAKAFRDAGLDPTKF